MNGLVSFYSLICYFHRLSHRYAKNSHVFFYLITSCMNKYLRNFGHEFSKCHLFLLFFIIILPSFTMSQSDKALLKKSRELSRNTLLVDGHIDLPYRIHKKTWTNQKELLPYVYNTTEGDFDLTRARKGGLNAAFMAVFIPADYQQKGGARNLADSLFGYLENMAKSQPDLWTLAGSPEDIQVAYDKKQFAIIPAIENGAAIENNLNNLSYFKNKGLAYMTLCHGKDNLICDSSYDNSRTWNGLSGWGRQVLDEMQKLGIMVDVSHVSDSAFYQIARHVRVPIIASHSSCRFFTPGFERNVSDDIIREIARLNGLVMVTFGSTFLDGKTASEYRERRQKYASLIQENKLIPDTREEIDFRREFDKTNPPVFADVSRVADHIDHIVRLVGIDYVGLGSDFDGVGDSLPAGLKDVSGYPNLIFHLLKRGYSEEDIYKICSGNLLRVWKEVTEKSRAIR